MKMLFFITVLSLSILHLEASKSPSKHAKQEIASGAHEIQEGARKTVSGIVDGAKNVTRTAVEKTKKVALSLKDYIEGKATSFKEGAQRYYASLKERLTKKLKPSHLPFEIEDGEDSIILTTVLPNLSHYKVTPLTHEMLQLEVMIKNDILFIRIPKQNVS